jgi:hypothetical protein
MRYIHLTDLAAGQNVGCSPDWILEPSSQVVSNPGTDLAGLRHRAQQNDAMAAPAAYPHDDWMFSASK